MSNIDFEIVKQLRQEGYTTNQACRYLGITVGKLKYLGWNKLPNPNKNLTGQYKKDNFYFDKIDTPNKAYILGFTLADGCIYLDGTLRYELHKKDVEILEFIKSEISPNSPLKPVNRIREFKGYKWESNTIRLTVKCKRFYYDLDHLGISVNKTYKKQSLPNIPWRLMPHFLRGYFDGDGSVWLHEGRVPYVNFTGEHNLLVELGDYLEYIKVTSKMYMPATVKNQSNSCLTIYKKSDVRNFYNYIYIDGFCLSRKKEKFNYELA